MACHKAELRQWRAGTIVGQTIGAHLASLAPENSDGRCFAGWAKLVGSVSLHQYAMDDIAAPATSAASTGGRQHAGEASGSAAPSLGSAGDQQAAAQSSQATAETVPFIALLASAASARKLSAARLSALLTHGGVLAPLRAAAEGHEAFRIVTPSLDLLAAGWAYFHEQRIRPRGSPEAHGAAQSAMLAALRQGFVLLQLRAAAPDQRQRAVRRARRRGYLLVGLLLYLFVPVFTLVSVCTCMH